VLLHKLSGTHIASSEICHCDVHASQYVGSARVTSPPSHVDDPEQHASAACCCYGSCRHWKRRIGTVSLLKPVKPSSEVAVIVTIMTELVRAWNQEARLKRPSLEK